MGDRSEVEERWRRECEEWRERVGRAEERERERIEELRIAEEKLACVTQEKTGRCSLYMYTRVLAKAGKQGGVTLLFFNPSSFFSLPPPFCMLRK